MSINDATDPCLDEMFNGWPLKDGTMFRCLCIAFDRRPSALKRPIYALRLRRRSPRKPGSLPQLSRGHSILGQLETSLYQRQRLCKS